MMIDLTPVFQALIALIAALITCWLIPWIKAKTTKQQQENLYAAAKIAVYAAEQIFGPKSGKDKFKYARDFLISIGYNVNTDVLEAAIESAVRTLPIKWDEVMADLTVDDDEGENETEPATADEAAPAAVTVSDTVSTPPEAHPPEQAE